MRDVGFCSVILEPQPSPSPYPNKTLYINTGNKIQGQTQNFILGGGPEKINPN